MEKMSYIGIYAKYIDTIYQCFSTQALWHTGVPSENVSVPYEILKMAPSPLSKPPLPLPHWEQNSHA